jgi:hypothetical protein
MAKNDRPRKCEYRKFITPAFRVSFPALDEPKLGPDGTGEPKYSVRMLFPKDMNDADATKFKALIEGCASAAKEFFGDSIPENLKKPRKDGDKSDYENEHGHWIMNARTNQKVGIVDERNVIMDVPAKIKEKLYAGCWARASVLVGATDKAGNSAVYLILQNVQFLKDDKPFGNRRKPTDDFEPTVFDKSQEDFKSESDNF